MPISPIILQRRQAELGRIRLGQKGDRGQPQKLSTFRFTSPSEAYIAGIAELYGGTAQPWDNAGKAEFEVFTDAKSIPVIAVKGGLSQWMETWSGGGCTHRCDGEVSALTGDACDPNDRAHRAAKPTTRLSVMLPELDAIGVFRLETHGWNAAAEIPAVAELAQYVGDLVPAQLHLVERRAVRDGRTSRFVVPVLDLRIGQARLREVVAAKSGAELAGPAPVAALGAGQQPAQPEAGAPAIAAPVPDYRAAADAAGSLDEVRALWASANQAGHLDPELQAYLKARGDALQQPAPAPAAAPDAEGIVDGEVVDEPASASTAQAPTGPDADQVWQQILTVAGQRGTPLPDLEDDVRTFFGGMTSAEASAAELSEYLTDLQGRAA